MLLPLCVCVRARACVRVCVCVGVGLCGVDGGVVFGSLLKMRYGSKCSFLVLY